MSALVVDASVVVKWFLPEVLANAALRVAASDRGFLAPELLGAEFANALWKEAIAWRDRRLLRRPHTR